MDLGHHLRGSRACRSTAPAGSRRRPDRKGNVSPTPWTTATPATAAVLRRASEMIVHDTSSPTAMPSGSTTDAGVNQVRSCATAEIEDQVSWTEVEPVSAPVPHRWEFGRARMASRSPRTSGETLRRRDRTGRGRTPRAASRSVIAGGLPLVSASHRPKVPSPRPSGLTVAPGVAPDGGRDRADTECHPVVGAGIRVRRQRAGRGRAPRFTMGRRLGYVR